MGKFIPFSFLFTVHFNDSVVNNGRCDDYLREERAVFFRFFARFPVFLIFFFRLLFFVV